MFAPANSFTTQNFFPLDKALCFWTSSEDLGGVMFDSVNQFTAENVFS